MGGVRTYWAIVAMLLFALATALPYLASADIERINAARAKMSKRAHAWAVLIVVAQFALAIALIGSILWLIWSARLGV